MKKQLALGMALLLGISSLTACGGGAAATTAAPAAAAETKAAETKAEAAETKAEETKAEAGETKAAPAGAKVVKFGNSGAVTEPAPQSCQEFCDIINEKIGDRYYFEFYPAE